MSGLICALSPDPVLNPYEKDYRWLTQIYESVKPPSGNGKLLWHSLGAKTVELINENVHVESVRDDVEALVMDAQVLQQTTQGERLVQKELRRTLLKYKLHTDQNLFDRTYSYIGQYY